MIFTNFQFQIASNTNHSLFKRVAGPSNLEHVREGFLARILALDLGLVQLHVRPGHALPDHAHHILRQPTNLEKGNAVPEPVLANDLTIVVRDTVRILKKLERIAVAVALACDTNWMKAPRVNSEEKIKKKEIKKK
jgi:hypothetical protein